MKILLILTAFLAGIVATIFSVNYFVLSVPLKDAVESDPRNIGISMRTHYKHYVNPTVLVIDIKQVSGEKSAADVFRLFLQYSSKMKDKDFKAVQLASKGKVKFVMKGDYFKTLGEEFGSQNPIYTMRTFPEHIYEPNGSRAFETWTGNWIGVVGGQIGDLTEFHKRWYIEDMADE